MTASKSAIYSAAGRKGAQRSPWSKGPACDTGKAKASYIAYCKRGKAKR